MTWSQFCVEKAEECELRSEGQGRPEILREWLEMAHDWRVAAIANDNDWENSESLADTMIRTPSPSQPENRPIPQPEIFSPPNKPGEPKTPEIPARPPERPGK